MAAGESRLGPAIHVKNNRLTSPLSLSSFSFSSSQKEQNYALSLCRRKTIHSGPLKNGKRYIREIKERDPWEERIKKNYEELQRLKRKRKAPETLEALEALDYYMFQTEWESESSDYSDSN